MSKYLKGAGTIFIISWKNKTLLEITEHGKVDWTAYVINWEPFLNIIRSGCKDHEKLMLSIGYDNETLVFFNFVLGGPLCVAADLVILNKSLKEENEMNEGMNRELTPEERIEQLEKEKAELQLQIKNQAKYDNMQKNGDELALAMKALQDSGFSRSEAMQLMSLTMMGNVIKPFMRR